MNNQEEGFKKIGKPISPFKFEMIYWADLMYEKPKNPEITNKEDPAITPLPVYRKLNSMVFCGLYPTESNNYNDLRDALEKLKAGATLIQIYTGFIYEGPRLVKRINRAILKEC